MTPAEQRIDDLIARWLASIELHLKYAALDEAKYWQVQTWPKHERPSKWVLDVAKQKIMELKALTEARRGDDTFAAALENMAFLANLVGLQHLQRFIPLVSESTAATVEAPVVKPTVAAKVARHEEPTREMPRLKVPAKASTPMPSAKSSTPPPPARASTAKAAKAEPKKSPTGGSTKGGPVPVVVTPEIQVKIVADAVRLLKWGKEWHELADTIARIAERPPASEIRKVLRSHKAEIEGKVAKSK